MKSVGPAILRGIIKYLPGKTCDVGNPVGVQQFRDEGLASSSSRELCSRRNSLAEEPGKNPEAILKKF
jgi:hypothetical protein